MIVTNPETMGEQPITRDAILQLMKRREGIEEQIQALGGILESNHIGMTESLVDAEGYPRNDIDVYQVRHARHKIICLQNDHKAVTKEIDQKLQVYYQQVRDRGGEPGDDAAMEIDSGQLSNPQLTPFLRVNLVSDGSPAFHAGMKVDDLILEFGSIHSENFRNLSDVGSLVQSSAGSVVPVKIRRDSRTISLALIPGPWSGKGLLGCNIVPYDTLDR